MRKKIERLDSDVVVLGFVALFTRKNELRENIWARISNPLNFKEFVEHFIGIHFFR